MAQMRSNGIWSSQFIVWNFEVVWTDFGHKIQNLIVFWYCVGILHGFLQIFCMLIFWIQSCLCVFAHVCRKYSRPQLIPLTSPAVIMQMAGLPVSDRICNCLFPLRNSLRLKDYLEISFTIWQLSRS